MYYLVYSTSPTDPFYPRERVAFVAGMENLRSLARELVPWPIPRLAPYQEIADSLAMYDYDVLKLTKAELLAVRPQHILRVLEEGDNHA